MLLLLVQGSHFENHRTLYLGGIGMWMASEPIEMNDITEGEENVSRKKIIEL